METQPNLEATSVSAQVTATITMPVGTVVSFVGQTPPNGWLLCDGSVINQSTYPNLYPLLISGKLPDLRSRFIVGTGQGAGLGNYKLNDTGGSEMVTLTTDQIPSHYHQINNGNFGLHHRSFDGSGGDDIPFETNPDGGYLSGTNYTGGGHPHENRPPYYALTFIIKY